MAAGVGDGAAKAHDGGDETDRKPLAYVLADGGAVAHDVLRFPRATASHPRTIPPPRNLAAMYIVGEGRCARMVLLGPR
jgi:hypothetical protein